MNEFLAQLGLFSLLIALLLPIGFGLFLFFAHRRLKGIERALWALVSQLQHLNRVPSAAESVAEIRSRSATEPHASHVSTSAFGR